jgi:hypothetical protein
LLRYYIARLSSEEDRGAVLQLLDAAGIGPETWTLGEAPQSEGDAGEEGAAKAGG